MELPPGVKCGGDDVVELPPGVKCAGDDAMELPPGVKCGGDDVMELPPGVNVQEMMHRAATWCKMWRGRCNGASQIHHQVIL